MEAMATGVDFLQFGKEANGLYYCTLALKDLEEQKAEVGLLLDTVKESITSMDLKQREAFCDQVWNTINPWSHSTNHEESANALKKLLCEGNVDSAKDCLSKWHSNEKKYFINLENSGAYIDCGTSFLVICCGYERLKLEDEKQLVIFQRSLRNLRTLLTNVRRTRQGLDALIDQAQLLLDNVQSRTDQRRSERNSAAVQGVLYAGKVAMNLARAYFLKNHTDALLYYVAAGLSGGASGTSFFVSYQYHQLVKTLQKDLAEVVEFYRSLSNEHED